MTKILLILALTAYILHTKSFAKSIICKTSNQLKSFRINKKTIAFISTDENSRSIASEKKAHSRNTRMGFTKTVKVEGKEHIIHITNRNHFSNLDDYYIIRNSKGHEVIYPLICSYK